MSDTPFEATARLARRVLDGEVVFFVGSGFSIDSEGNSATRLVGRLLAALLAMGTVLAERAGGTGSQAVSLLDGLAPVFGIKGVARPGDIARQPALCMTRANLDLIAREYYNFNEWSVSALGVLSGELLAHADRAALAAQMQRLATFLLTLVDDVVPLDRIDCIAMEGFGTDAGARGKALFLDVMGFANSAIMAGTPGERQVTHVAASYGGRLRPRHHVLARLAREGLASAVVTTNYDLLLEGAYRLAGFVDRENTELAPDGMPHDRVPRFTRIAGTKDFFARGRGYRTALLLKIHGCAETYRDVRSRQIEELRQRARGAADTSVNQWAQYLGALVFTYREIQTWRADAWSRDLVRTLLRTHTIALCGYSGADPIMHSTFREVFEEKAVSQRTTRLRRSDDGPRNASVFFFGLAGRREFHSLEILRAATVAGGFSPEKLLEHPNHIEFERESGFPNVDDHFRWLMHCVVRQLQSDALKTQTRRLKPRLFQLQCPDSEFATAQTRFDTLCQAEHTLVAATLIPNDQRPAAARRRQLDMVVGWTWHFVPGLLREMALAEAVESYQGAGRAFQAKRTWSYYHPASEHLERTAWAAIVEIAMRRLVAAVRGGHELAVGDAVAEESPYAAMSFNNAADDPPQPSALCVRVAGFERPFGAAPLTGAFRRIGYWELSPRDVPWPVTRTDRCPGPKEIWDWALSETLPSRATAARELAGLS